MRQTTSDCRPLQVIVCRQRFAALTYTCRQVAPLPVFNCQAQPLFVSWLGLANHERVYYDKASQTGSISTHRSRGLVTLSCRCPRHHSTRPLPHTVLPRGSARNPGSECDRIRKAQADTLQTIDHTPHVHLYPDGG